MRYKHGIYTSEVATKMATPVSTDSAIQVVVGTAPINTLSNKPINEPIIAYSFEEAAQKLGYSKDYHKYTLCQSMDMAFDKYKVGPVVFINVLDPSKHTTELITETVTVENGRIALERLGIILDTLTVDTFVKDVDYIAEFDVLGKVNIIKTSSSTIQDNAQITITYKQLDASKVTESDIIGSVEPLTGKRTGIQVIDDVYLKLNVVPNIILSPGFSHKPGVGIALQEKAKKITSIFQAIAIIDVDPSIKPVDIEEWKRESGLVDSHTYLCYPKVVYYDQIYFLSSLVAACIAYVDAENDNIPYVSPSNNKAIITGSIFEDGLEFNADLDTCNAINALGVATVLNLCGWKLWGNETAAFPKTSDVKDRFISVKRMFIWDQNVFILKYFEKVDNASNSRLVEFIVDQRNYEYNGLVSMGALLRGEMKFIQEDNKIDDLLKGKLKFRTKFTVPLPAQDILNEWEFDVDALKLIFGGAE